MQKIENKELIREINKYKVILLPVGINNCMFSCFLNEVAVNFKGVKETEAAYKYGNRDKFGNVFVVQNNGIFFCFCYVIINGNVNNEFLKACMDEVEKRFDNCKIGISIAKKNPIDAEGMAILSALDNLDVYYDDEETLNKKCFHLLQEYKKKYKDNKITRKEYLDQKEQINWELLNGIYAEKPDGWKKDDDEFSFLKK